MASPIRPPYGAPLSFDQAKRAAAAAEAEARRNNWRVAIAIVEPSGELVHFSKLDDTQYGSIPMAINKATCAARFRRASKEFSDQFVGGEVRSLTMPGAVAAEGGVPIMIDGHIVGAIGVSGATAEEDGQVAAAGVKAVLG